MGNQVVSLPDEGQQSQMTGKQTGVFAGPSNQSQSEEDWTQSNKHPASLCGEPGSQSQSKIMADGKQPAVAEAKNNLEVPQGDEANKNRRRVFIKTPSRNQVDTITVNGEQVAVPWDRDIVEYHWVYEDEADPDDIVSSSQLRPSLHKLCRTADGF